MAQFLALHPIFMSNRATPSTPSLPDYTPLFMLCAIQIRRSLAATPNPSYGCSKRLALKTCQAMMPSARCVNLFPRHSSRALTALLVAANGGMIVCDQMLQGRQASANTYQLFLCQCHAVICDHVAVLEPHFQSKSLGFHMYFQFDKHVAVYTLLFVSISVQDANPTARHGRFRSCFMVLDSHTAGCCCCYLLVVYLM